MSDVSRDLHERLDRPFYLHVDMRGGCGIGDWLMISPALAAYKRQWPQARIVIHSHPQSREVFMHNPDIYDVRLSYEQELTQTQEPGRIVEMKKAFGREGTIRLAFDLLGVADKSDRRLHLFVLREEQEYVAEHVKRLHLDPEKWLVAVQTHGSWKTKRWRYLPLFLRRLVDAGAQVVVFGSEMVGHRQGEFGPGILDLRARTPYRLAAIIIALSDCFVGFDSGLTLSAIALGTPAVGLVGSHDPRWLLGDSHGQHITLIRRRTPADCKRGFGISCREEGRIGDWCPLRGGSQQDAALGADCIDDIWPGDVFTEAAAMPRWGGIAFEKRYRAHWAPEEEIVRAIDSA